MFTTDTFQYEGLPAVFIPSFITFLMFFMGINSWSAKISSKLFKSYDTLSTTEQLDWCSRIASNIHAIGTAVVGMAVFFSEPRYYEDMDLLHRENITAILFGFSTSYLIVDAVIVLRNPALGGIPILLHHVFVTLSQFSMLFYNKMYLLGVVTCFTEVTTLFINQRWYFEKACMKDGILYVVNGLMIWLFWLIFRIGHAGYLAFLFYSQREVLYGQAPLILSGFITTSAILLASLNIMWFQKITAGILKVLTKKKKSA
jgi:hypothetical protein